MKHQVLFSLKNNEKIFMNVVCCTSDWRFKGLITICLVTAVCVLDNSAKLENSFFECLSIGIGRFRILGGPRFRIWGGPRGGQIPSRHMTS